MARFGILYLPGALSGKSQEMTESMSKRLNRVGLEGVIQYALNGRSACSLKEKVGLFAWYACQVTMGV